MKKHHCDFEREPIKRERPVWAGDVDTTPVGEYWDVQHKAHPPVPECGYGMPPLMPNLPPFNPNLSMPSQIESLTHRVNDLIDTLNGYTENVYGAYDAIVQSALCNDAYYKEVTIEEGYIPDASAKYRVVHIPFVDRVGEPIYLELGLAYNNTTNSGVKEKSFDASQRLIADKFIPAINNGSNWYGKVYWKNAPLPTTEDENVKYTVGVTENGFIKWYANTVDDRTMTIDKVRNSIGVRSVLIASGELVPDMWESTESTLLARVGLGMNYTTKERFLVVVEGSDRTGCTTEQFANIFRGYACDVAVECANGDSSYMLDKGEMCVIPSTVDADNAPTVPESNCFWYITKRRHYKNQYVKDVANMTQRLGEEIWNTELADKAVDKIKDYAISIMNKLDTEIEDRKNSDSELNDKIDAESARLDKRVDDEAVTRNEEDAKLDTRITTEVATLNTKIDEEAARLDKRVDDETATRSEEDAKLDTRITAEVETLNKRIESEVETLVTADNQLRTDLITEQTARISNDINSVEILQDGTKNIYRLKRNDNTYLTVPVEVYDYTLLVTKLDELSQVEVRLNTEIEERKKADDELKAKDEILEGSITTEISDRKSADVVLNKAINTETENRTNEDTAIKALITAEQTARETGDSNLATQISELKSQYEAFVTRTDSDIAGIETDIEAMHNTISEISKTVSANKTDVDTKITNLSGRLTSQETINADNVTKIGELTGKLNTMQTTVSALNETVTSLQAAFASTEQSFENVKKTVAEMQSELNTFEARIEASIKEVNDKFGSYLPLTGGTMQGEINMDSHILSGLSAAKFTGYNLSNTIYASEDISYPSFSTSDNTSRIAVIVGDAVHDDQAATLKQVKSEITNETTKYIPKTGASDITGSLSFQSNDETYPYIENASAIRFKSGQSIPVTAAIDVDSDGYLSLMSNNNKAHLSVEDGNINVHDNYISNLNDGISGQDAVTLHQLANYVTGIASFYPDLSSDITCYASSFNELFEYDFTYSGDDFYIINVYFNDNPVLGNLGLIPLFTYTVDIEKHLIKIYFNVYNATGANKIIPSGTIFSGLVIGSTLYDYD